MASCRNPSRGNSGGAGMLAIRVRPAASQKRSRLGPQYPPRQRRDFGRPAQVVTNPPIVNTCRRPRERIFVGRRGGVGAGFPAIVACGGRGNWAGRDIELGRGRITPRDERRSSPYQGTASRRRRAEILLQVFAGIGELHLFEILAVCAARRPPVRPIRSRPPWRRN